MLSEMGVAEDASAGGELVEGVLVELADKGGELVVLEVEGEDLVREEGGVVDDEGGALGGPFAEGVCGGVRDEGVELEDERGEELCVSLDVRQRGGGRRRQGRRTRAARRASRRRGRRHGAH